MSEGNNIAIENLSYVREVDNKNLLSGELEKKFNLTHLNPLLARRGKEKEEFLARRGFVWIICFLSLLFPFPSHATCTPTPDCASIGYTETSCETDYLACPFDTSKLFCVPCDSSFKYDCTGDNITGGTGDSCGGKYVSCECSDGLLFKDGGCVCDDSCTVGAIYYSDGTCSACVDSNKTIVGIVVKDNELIISEPIQIEWGVYGEDISELTNFTSSSTAISDMNGKSNTSIIVTSHRTAGLTSSNSAAIYCNSYTGGISETSGEWYLPSVGEMYSYVYGNYNTLNPVVSMLNWQNFYGGNLIWTSSEYDYEYAWSIHADIGGRIYDIKTGSNLVTCFLSIN